MDRQDRLLFLLVKENDCSKSIQEIAELFGVTARTIRNDIEALNDVLICNGAIIKIERKGISIEIQDKEKLEDYLQSIESNRERVLTAQDRVRQIIETLLTSDESVRMDDLADASLRILELTLIIVHIKVCVRLVVNNSIVFV